MIQMLRINQRRLRYTIETDCLTIETDTRAHGCVYLRSSLVTLNNGGPTDNTSYVCILSGFVAVDFSSILTIPLQF